MAPYATRYVSSKHTKIYRLRRQSKSLRPQVETAKEDAPVHSTLCSRQLLSVPLLLGGVLETELSLPLMCPMPVLTGGHTTSRRHLPAIPATLTTPCYLVLHLTASIITTFAVDTTIFAVYTSPHPQSSVLSAWCSFASLACSLFDRSDIYTNESPCFAAIRSNEYI